MSVSSRWRYSLGAIMKASQSVFVLVEVIVLVVLLLVALVTNEHSQAEGRAFE